VNWLKVEGRLSRDTEQRDGLVQIILARDKAQAVDMVRSVEHVDIVRLTEVAIDSVQLRIENSRDLSQEAEIEVDVEAVHHNLRLAA